MMLKTIKVRLIVIFFILTLNSGCTSSLVRVSSVPTGDYEVVAKVTGKSCGALLFSIIPIGLNGRAAQAYQNALNSAPGATKIINVTISDDWYWWLLGQSHCFTLTGEAI